MALINDLKDLNNLDSDQFDLLIREFNHNPLSTISDISKFEKFCEEKGIEIQSARKLHNVLGYVVFSFIEKKSIQEGLKEFEEEVINTYKEELNNIWSNIKGNIDGLSGFINYVKEKQLKNVSNNILNFKIICDVRPLFDVERKDIIKYTLPIILSIRSDSKKSNIVFELEDEDELYNIKKEVDAAVRKFEVLKMKFKND